MAIFDASLGDLDWPELPSHYPSEVPVDTPCFVQGLEFPGDLCSAQKALFLKALLSDEKFKAKGRAESAPLDVEVADAFSQVLAPCVGHGLENLAQQDDGHARMFSVSETAPPYVGLEVAQLGSARVQLTGAVRVVYMSVPFTVQYLAAKKTATNVDPVQASNLLKKLSADDLTEIVGQASPGDLYQGIAVAGSVRFVPAGYFMMEQPVPEEGKGFGVRLPQLFFAAATNSRMVALLKSLQNSPKLASAPLVQKLMVTVKRLQDASLKACNE